MRIDLGSTRLAFGLIVGLIVLIGISTVIPQQGFAESQVLDWKEALGPRYELIERLGLDRIYFSPPLFVVLALLAVNLVVGNVRRFRTVLRVERTLLKARHVGSIVFHLSLLLIIGGVGLNYLYKFHGVYGLTEGQTVADDPANYHRVFTGPLYDDSYGRFEMTLEKVHEVYQVGDASTEAAEITVRSPSGADERRETVRINRPLGRGGLEYHLGSRIGYSPELVVTDTSGRSVFRSFVRLSTRRVEGRVVYSDFVVLPDGETRVLTSVTPDPESAVASPGTIEVEVEVERDGVALFQGSLENGDTASVGDLRIAVPRLRRWCMIEVVKSPFLGTVFTGFWTGLAGLTISAAARVGRKGDRA